LLCCLMLGSPIWERQAGNKKRLARRNALKTNRAEFAFTAGFTTSRRRKAIPAVSY
jgi:hypothetical protein